MGKNKRFCAGRFRRVLAFIKQHPEKWDQGSACGSCCCFLGHANKMAMAENPVKYDIACGVEENSSKWLGITRDEAGKIYDPDTTLEDLEDFLAKKTAK